MSKQPKKFEVAVKEILARFGCEDRFSVIAVDLAMIHGWPLNPSSVRDHIEGLVCTQVVEIPSDNHVAVFESVVNDNSGQDLGTYILFFYKSSQFIKRRKEEIIAPMFRRQKIEARLVA